MNDVIVCTFGGTKPPPQFVVSAFNNKSDNVPSACQYPDFSDLARDIMAMGHEARTEKDGPAISAAEYAAGAKRGNVNVTRVHGLFLDFDKLTEQQMQEVLKAVSAFEYLAYSTFSDQPGQRCFRLLIPFAEAVLPADYAAYWSTINDLTGGLVDPATKDVSRISYLPAHPPGAQGHFIDYHAGQIGGAA